MSTAVDTNVGSVTLQANLPSALSLADVQLHLGGVPLQRIRLIPPPGYATEEDVPRIEARYFEAGIRCVWYIHPATRSATVYTSPDHPTRIDPNGEIGGGGVLPAFRLSLSWLFEQADRQSPSGSGKQ
jgi:hypothetical protein